MDSKEYRKPSIVDTFTPLQAQAWDIEHQVVDLPQDSPIKMSYLVAARTLRHEDMHLKIKELFNRCDAGNAILDGIAQEAPLSTPMEQGVDYALMMQ